MRRCDSPIKLCLLFGNGLCYFAYSCIKVKKTGEFAPTLHLHRKFLLFLNVVVVMCGKYINLNKITKI